MADNEKGEETYSRGNEWEVVSLTASTYAAAPGPEGFESNDDKGHEFVEDEHETSRAMFMSGHFVFPPSEQDNSEIDNETKDVPIASNKVLGLEMEVGDKSDKKNDENWDMKGLTVPEELPGMQYFDEKGNRLSDGNTEFEEGVGLQGLNLVDDDSSIYSAAKFSSFHAEANDSGSNVYDEHNVVDEPCDLSQQSLNSTSDLSKSTSDNKKDEYNGRDLPCEAWWKRGAASLYAHAKEANAFWSIFVAAALMGLVIIGQRWQDQQLKSQFSIKDEMNRMLGPISRLKDVIVGGHRRGSTIRGSTEH
ncbi:ATG8-interacting protein 1-like isoform X2 [Telopea speciosissima]|uniref:ATG8-interacting protein 1-like isoform X2 n=1 Tax=Telopea speciosissima TaxID=54955 RepID=UPI001CC68CCA|nr:ATG8-interacting protein 1-like isoform X2 [Telopea speciosissima]